MRSCLAGVTTVAATVLALTACSSSEPSVIGPVEGFSESHLQGRFALSAPVVREAGGRIVADTLVLEADRSVRRYFYIENSAGVVSGAWHGGGYQITGDSIRIAYSTTSGGGYGLFAIVPMAVLGTSSRVTRLEADSPDGKLTYDRVRSR
jgi:hypothetical protein